MCMYLSIILNNYFTNSDRNGRPSYYNTGMFLLHSRRYYQILTVTRVSLGSGRVGKWALWTRPGVGLGPK